MGIVRYPVECPGCEKKIVLRLAVGHDERQPFFYVCPSCQAATRGALLWHGDARTSLELSEGKKLDSEDACDATISINPEIPSVADAKGLEELGGSAFLMFTSMMGIERWLAFQQATGRVLGIRASDGPALARLTTYYLNRDWPNFDKCLKTLTPSEHHDLSEKWKRDHIIHNLYDRWLLPIYALDDTPYYPEMKKAFNALWTASRPNFAALVSFANRESTTDDFLNVQRDLFGHIAQYTKHLGGLLPGLLCNMLPAADQSKVDDFRLFRDEYEIFRDLYIQSFETCHKALRWVIGAVNADSHGASDKFVIPAQVTGFPKNPPKNIDAFSELVSANKRKWLVDLPVWDQYWDVVFDRHLRNDIGHASARHDLRTGLIHRDMNPPVAYTRFVQRVQRAIHALVSTLNAMKMSRIYSAMKP